MLSEERIPAARRRYEVRFDCRYVKQYHEVSFIVPASAIERQDAERIAQAFHAEHNRLYGYSLEAERTPVELINVRVQAIGATDPPHYPQSAWSGPDPSHARKGRRAVYIPEANAFSPIDIFDGHALRSGNRIGGPALIETATTAVFVSASFDCVVDRYGSFALFKKGREDLVRDCIEATREKVPA